MNAALTAFEAAFTAGKTTPAMREAIAAYREVYESIQRSMKHAADRDEAETLEWLAYCVELQAEQHIRREMERT